MNIKQLKKALDLVNQQLKKSPFWKYYTVEFIPEDGDHFIGKLSLKYSPDTFWVMGITKNDLADRVNLSLAIREFFNELCVTALRANLILGVEC